MGFESAGWRSLLCAWHLFTCRKCLLCHQQCREEEKCVGSAGGASQLSRTSNCVIFCTLLLSSVDYIILCQSSCRRFTVGDKIWLAIGIPVHSKGVEWGWCQGTEQNSQTLPHQTGKTVCLWTFVHEGIGLLKRRRIESLIFYLFFYASHIYYIPVCVFLFSAKIRRLHCFVLPVN